MTLIIKYGKLLLSYIKGALHLKCKWVYIDYGWKHTSLLVPMLTSLVKTDLKQSNVSRNKEFKNLSVLNCMNLAFRYTLKLGELKYD